MSLPGVRVRTGGSGNPWATVDRSVASYVKNVFYTDVPLERPENSWGTVCLVCFNDSPPDRFSNSSMGGGTFPVHSRGPTLSLGQGPGVWLVLSGRSKTVPPPGVLKFISPTESRVKLPRRHPQSRGVGS